MHRLVWIGGALLLPMLGGQKPSLLDLGAPEWTWIEESCATDFRLRVEFRAADGEALPLAWIALNYQDPQRTYLAELGPQGGRFLKVDEGGIRPLGEVTETSKELPVHLPAEVILKRDEWEMSLVVAGRRVAWAYDEDYRGGRLGLAVGAGIHFEEPVYQPLEPFFFTDDFMRAEGSEGEWRVLRGRWRSGSPREGTAADPRLSANPFFYRATPDGSGVVLATVGHWFWDRYAVQAAVHLPTQGAAGLCGFLQDADHYLLFRVADPGPQARAQLLAIVGGQEQLLQEGPWPTSPGEWVALRLEMADEWLEGWIDGQKVCAAENRWWTQGPAGLYLQGAVSTVARLAAADGPDGEGQFDDVLLESRKEFRAKPPAPLRLAAESPSRQEGSLWTWVLDRIRSQVAGAEQELPGERAAFVVTGSRDWSGYTVQVKVQPAEDSPVGLCVNYWDAGHFDLLRGRPGGGSLWLWEWIQITPRGSRVLAHSEGRWRRGAWQTLTVVVTGPVLQAQVNSGPALAVRAHAELPPGSAPAGRIGLYAADPATRFRDLVVSFPELGGTGFPPSDPAVTEQFTAEETMAQWSTREAAWRKGEEGWVWHRGMFPGDAALSFPLPRCPKGGMLQAILGGDGRNPERGYQLQIRLQPSQTLQSVLQQEGRILAKAGPVAWSPGDTLTFKRQAGLLQAQLNGRPLMVYPTAGPAAGPCIGFRTRKVPFDRGTLDQPPYGALPLQKKRSFWHELANAVGNILLSEALEKNAPDLGRVFNQSGYQIDFFELIQPSPPKPKKVNATTDETLEVAELGVQSPHFLDCTFASAPVDWRVGEGIWQVTQRWTCSPQWTFFGGKDAPRPTLWSKTAYFGDTVLECFLAKPMHPETGQDTPVELNLSLCADGQSVDSGYSFILAGEGGKVNRILRRGRTVAEGRYRPTNANPHRAWYAVRVEKIGGRLRFTVDGRDLLAYTDPEPLPGGHVAFWSDAQGLLIARVRLSFERSQRGMGRPGESGPEEVPLGTWEG